MIKSFINSALRKKQMPEETACYMNVGSVDEEGFHEYIPHSHKRIVNVIRPADGQNKEGSGEEEDVKEVAGKYGTEEHHACFGERFYSNADDVRIDIEKYASNQEEQTTPEDEE